jgi:hypothetical protein
LTHRFSFVLVEPNFFYMRRVLPFLLILTTFTLFGGCKSSEAVTDPAPPTRLPEFSLSPSPAPAPGRSTTEIPSLAQEATLPPEDLSLLVD